MATIIIQRLNGTTYDLDALGFRVKKFDPPLTNWSYSYQQLGTYGASMTGAQASYLVIPLTLDITAHSIADYRLQLMELRRIFRSDEDFYVIDTMTPYMRWRCRAEPAAVSQTGNYWRASDVTINLDCADGFAESVSTTQDGIDYNHQLWGFGQNLPISYTPKYTYSTADFTFYNAGNIPLMADDRPVTIRFTGSAPSGFTLTNQTTGQTLKITKAITPSDQVIIQGFIPLINGQQAYGVSNHGYLDFRTGENRLHIDGANNFTLKFDTRFYY